MGNAVQAVGHGQRPPILAVGPTVPIPDSCDKIINRGCVIDSCMRPCDEQAAMVVGTSHDTLDPRGGAVRLQVIFVGQALDNRFVER